jgi:hypothetical protein
MAAVARDVPSDVGSGKAFFASGAGRGIYYLKASTGAVGSARLASADPTNRKAAMLDDAEGWREAERKEIANHIENSTLSPISFSQVPRGRKLVRMTWVYKRKRDGKQKARLCVQGSSQVHGIDFDQVWSGTLRASSLRTLSSIAAKENLTMRRWDFVAAFLQGELLEEEDVYCSMPPGYATGLDPSNPTGNGVVLKVNKPIYGMAQAGRRWQRTLFPYLVRHGFTATDSDPCVFRRLVTVQTPDGPRVETLLIGVYVDDLFVLYSHDDEHSFYFSFTKQLMADWNVEDEGPIADLLNIEITQSDGKVKLAQTSYITKLVDTHAPVGSVLPSHQAVKTPCDETLVMHVADALSSEDEIDDGFRRRYQSLVGALLYCSVNTRPDVAFAVGYLCRAMAKPTDELFDDALRVLYYLERTKDLGLTYEGDDLALYGMTDSDWAVKHSTSGFVFMLNKAAISWGSKKQTSVALSSCEAELMAGSEAAKEAIYHRRYQAELGYADPKPTKLAMDNQGSIAIAYNPELHTKTKHIARRHFFIRELVEDQQISVPFVKTVDNWADFFTKPLKPKHFTAMRNSIMNIA